MVPKLRFKEFCGEWEDKRLGDVIQYFYNGQTPSRNNLNFWNGNIPWVSSGELNYNTIKCTNEYITEDGKRNAHLKLLPKGTFLIAITGLEAAGTRGSCAFLGIDATTNQSCMALVPYEKKLNSKFLFQWYMKIGEHYGIKYTQGTKQQSYNIDLLKRLPIILPDNLYEQTKIADFLSTVDDKIQNQQDKITHLENIKKGFMQKIFSRKIRFKDDGGEEFPEWEEKKLGDVIDLVIDNRGKTPPISKVGYPLIEINAVGNYKIKYKLIEKYVDEEIFQTWFRKYLKRGDILFSTVGNTALCSYYDEKEKCCIAQNIVGLRFNSLCDSRFMFYLLTETKNNRYIKSIQMQAIQPSIKVTQFIKLYFYIPCLKEQQKIADFLSSFDEKIYTERETLEHLKELKNGLLQQMFV